MPVLVIFPAKFDFLIISRLSWSRYFKMHLFYSWIDFPPDFLSLKNVKENKQTTDVKDLFQSNTN